jgi:hypothetical protein
MIFIIFQGKLRRKLVTLPLAAIKVLKDYVHLLCPHGKEQDVQRLQ